MLEPVRQRRRCCWSSRDTTRAAAQSASSDGRPTCVGGCSCDNASAHAARRPPERAQPIWASVEAALAVSAAQLSATSRILASRPRGETSRRARIAALACAAPKRFKHDVNRQLYPIVGGSRATTRFWQPFWPLNRARHSKIHSFRNLGPSEAEMQVGSINYTVPHLGSREASTSAHRRATATGRCA